VTGVIPPSDMLSIIEVSDGIDEAKAESESESVHGWSSRFHLGRAYALTVVAVVMIGKKEMAGKE